MTKHYIIDEILENEARKKAHTQAILEVRAVF